MKNIIIGFFIIGELIVYGSSSHDKLRWACEDKVIDINVGINEGKKLSTPEKTEKFRDLLNTTYQVAYDCKSTDLNKNFDMDAVDFLGTDNLIIKIKKIISGEKNLKTLHLDTKSSIISEAKYISYNYNYNWAIFEIDGHKTELKFKFPERLKNHKNKILTIKYNPETGELYDIYLKNTKVANNISHENLNNLEEYTNERFGFTLQYPSNVLTEKTYPENGDGIWLTNKTGTVELIPSGRNAIETHNIKEVYTDTINLKHEDKNIEITYKVQKKNWFVLSGYDHKEKTIFYEKRYFIESGGEDNMDVVVGFNIKFPTQDKKKYENLVNIVAKSFKLAKHNKSVSVQTKYNSVAITPNKLETYARACAKRNADACFNLGEMHDKGIGVKKNTFNALEYYGLACGFGNYEGCKRVANTKENRQHVQEDYYDLLIQEMRNQQ